jgi:hypothetical protein
MEQILYDNDPNYAKKSADSGVSVATAGERASLPDTASMHHTSASASTTTSSHGKEINLDTKNS